jgi:hypothetical protein
MRKILATVLILFIYSTIIFARPVIRIKFPKRATKVNVSANLNGYNDSQNFVIKLLAGQTIKLNTNKPVTLSITDPNGNDVSDMDSSCNSQKTIENTISGDYKIKAVEYLQANAWKGIFKLTVDVK